MQLGRHLPASHLILLIITRITNTLINLFAMHKGINTFMWAFKCWCPDLWNCLFSCLPTFRRNLLRYLHSYPEDGSSSFLRNLDDQFQDSHYYVSEDHNMKNVKSEELRWMWHTSHIGEKGKSCNIIVKTPEGKNIGRH